MKDKLKAIAKIIIEADGWKQPLRNQPDYGVGESVLDKLAENAGTDLETLYRDHKPFPG